MAAMEHDTPTSTAAPASITQPVRSGGVQDEWLVGVTTVVQLALAAVIIPSAIAPAPMSRPGSEASVLRDRTATATKPRAGTKPRGPASRVRNPEATPTTKPENHPDSFETGLEAGAGWRRLHGVAGLGSRPCIRRPPFVDASEQLNAPGDPELGVDALKVTSNGRLREAGEANLLHDRKR